MQTSEQIQAPACSKCDDLGVVPGNLFTSEACDCAVGVTLDSRAQPCDYSIKCSAAQYLATLAAPERRTDVRTECKAAASMESIANSHARSIMGYLNDAFRPKDLQGMIERFIVRAMGEAIPGLVNNTFNMERQRDAARAELVDVKAALATAEEMLAMRTGLHLVEQTPAGQPSVLDAFMAADLEPEDSIAHGAGA